MSSAEAVSKHFEEACNQVNKTSTSWNLRNVPDPFSGKSVIIVRHANHDWSFTLGVVDESVSIVRTTGLADGVQSALKGLTSMPMSLAARANSWLPYLDSIAQVIQDEKASQRAQIRELFSEESR